MANNQNTQKIEQFLFKRGGKYTVIAGSICVIHLIYLFFFYIGCARIKLVREHGNLL